MAKILFECADEDKALWVETAASERLSLSAWIRRTLTATLTEREARGVAQPPGETASESQSAGLESQRRIPPKSSDPPAGLGTAARVDASRSASAACRMPTARGVKCKFCGKAHP